MNLEKLLAANMLRFGTKNLNEGTIDPQLKKVFDSAELAGLEKFLLTQVKASIGTVVTYAGTKHYFVCTRIGVSNQAVASLEPQFQCTPYYVGSRSYQRPRMQGGSIGQFPDAVARAITINYNSKPRSSELNLYASKTASNDFSANPRLSLGEVRNIQTAVTEISYNFNMLGQGAADWAKSQANGEAATRFAKAIAGVSTPGFERELSDYNTTVAGVKAAGGVAAAYYNALPAQIMATAQKTPAPVKKP